MKNILRSALIITIVLVICTAFVGCRRKDNDNTSSGGMMSDMASTASDVMSNVESGMHGIMDPSTSSSGNSQTQSGITQNATSSN